RHTRFSRDWSSDVCSSDLGDEVELFGGCHEHEVHVVRQVAAHGGELKFELEIRHCAQAPDDDAQVVLSCEVDGEPGVASHFYIRSEERRVGKGCRSRWCAC